MSSSGASGAVGSEGAAVAAAAEEIVERNGRFSGSGHAGFMAKVVSGVGEESNQR